MSETMIGADLEGLDQLSRLLCRKAEHLEYIQNAASAEIESSVNLWVGDDAVRFRQEWAETYRPRLTVAAEALVKTASIVERNRLAQEATSATLSPGGPNLTPSVDRSKPPTKVDEAQEQVTALIDKGDDDGISEGELDEIARTLAGLSDEDRSAVLSGLADEQKGRLFDNVHSSSFWSNDWNDDERAAFYRSLTSLPTKLKRDLGRFSPYLDAMADVDEALATGTVTTDNLNDLLDAEGFNSLDFEQRTNLLHAVANHPETESVANLSLMAEQEWIRGMDNDDFERSAKLIGYLSVYEKGDPTLIANTLDGFLGEDAPYSFDWGQEGGAYGSAKGTTFHFNPKYLDAGDAPALASVPPGGSQPDTLHMVTHTVAHEVNHLVNGDSVSPSYEYFMGEYRAYYVGYLAEHGAPPTRADVEARVEFLLTAKSGAYSNIAAAVDDPVEGPLIASFVSEVVGRPVSATDVVAEMKAGVDDPSNPAPIPVSVDGGPNNLTNDLDTT